MPLQIYDENPNQLTGGTGCLYAGEHKGRDCAGPYIKFEGRVFSPVSPLPVICAYHAGELSGEIARAEAKGQVQRLPGRSRREGIPDDPRLKGQRPAVTDQPDSPTLSQDQLAAAIAPPKRRATQAKRAPVKPLVKRPDHVEDTPDI